MKTENIKWILFSFSLIAILFSVQLLFIINETWVADYWEHRAILYELYRNPFNPDHPIVNEKIPHAFFSPYMVGLALLARILSISPSKTFDFAAIGNLAFFVIAVWMLARLFLNEYNKFKSFFFYFL